LVQEIDTYELRWKSLNKNGKVWFERAFGLTGTSLNGKSSFYHYPVKDETISKVAIAETLSKILSPSVESKFLGMRGIW
jgi:hypothetical protein